MLTNRRTVVLLVFGLPALFAQMPAMLPRHLFEPGGSLTGPSAAAPRAIAEEHVRALASTAGLSADDFAGAYLYKEYQTAHNGVTHLVYRQRFEGIEVYNADYVVNIDRDGRVINSGGVLYGRPGAGVGAPALAQATAALHAALRAVRPGAPAGYLVAEAAAAPGKTSRFARAGFADPIEGEPVWQGVNGVLRPA